MKKSRFSEEQIINILREAEGGHEIDSEMERLVRPLGVECIDALEMRKHKPSRILRGWELKPYASRENKSG